MKLNNALSASRATLPLTIVYFAGVCLLAENFIGGIWRGAVCTLLAGYFLEMTNVRNVLVKGYSRLTVCFFLVLSAATIRLTPSLEGAVVQLMFILFLFTILHTYQQRYAPGTFFVAFLFLGVGSLLFVQLLYYVPLLWLLIALRLQSSSLKNFLASLCGLVLPYFFWSLYILYTLDPSLFIAHFEDFISFGPLFSGLTEIHLYVALIILSLLNVCSIGHYSKYCMNESLRNRMLYSIIFYLTLITLIFLALQPQHAEVLLRLLLLTTCMGLGHYFSFAKDKFTHYLTIALMILIPALTAVAIWNL